MATSQMKNTKARRWFAIIFLVCFVLMLFSSCLNNNQKIKETEETLIPATNTETVIQVEKTATSTKTLIPSKTPTATITTISTTSYRFIDEELKPSFIYEEPTQQVIKVYVEKPSLDKYLYQNAIITIWFENVRYENWANINLDNLENNTFENSDLQLRMSCGTDCFSSIHTINDSVYYLTDQSVSDFDSCLSHFPINEMNHSDYNLQGVFYFSKNNYCVLTNEGRMAIIKLKGNGFGDDFSESYSFYVTVYNEILE